MKLIRFTTVFIFLINIFFIGESFAGLIIDNGTYTTIEDKDWLDFSETIGQTQSQALANNLGWRAATQDEMKHMMESFFTDTLLNWDSFNQSPHGYAQYTEKGKLFVQYFGATDGGDSSYGTSEGHGLVGIDQYYYAGLGYEYDDINHYSSWTGVALLRDSKPITVNEPLSSILFAIAALFLYQGRINRLNS